MMVQYVLFSISLIFLSSSSFLIFCSVHCCCCTHTTSKRGKSAEKYPTQTKHTQQQMHTNYFPMSITLSGRLRCNMFYPVCFLPVDEPIVYVFIHAFIQCTLYVHKSFRAYGPSQQQKKRFFFCFLRLRHRPSTIETNFQFGRSQFDQQARKGAHVFMRLYAYKYPKCINRNTLTLKHTNIKNTCSLFYCSFLLFLLLILLLPFFAASPH